MKNHNCFVEFVSRYLSTEVRAQKANHLLALRHYNVPEAPPMKTIVDHRRATGNKPICTYAYLYLYCTWSPGGGQQNGKTLGCSGVLRGTPRKRGESGYKFLTPMSWTSSKWINSCSQSNSSLYRMMLEESLWWQCGITSLQTCAPSCRNTSMSRIQCVNTVCVIQIQNDSQNLWTWSNSGM